MEQTGHQLAKKFTMTGLPTKSLDEKGWPSTVCDSKLGRGRPRSSCETDGMRSEEHTSELQSQSNLVCRLLLEKKKKQLLRTIRRDGTSAHRLRTHRRFALT